ncbi:hypothetical protein [Evansella tamaricis]|uniref:Uncharacterized protein n=1 Tax=Evansella tamaricis TaxID=2069301 RepID=A0ABS6JL28_9BACI|nr:hypothetical protein [Evansella tamaricis]MBU9713120.1 hypothetical protein [Evansella tamaricis]
MKYQPISYFEKLENLYVLMETREMLQKKLNEVEVTDPGYGMIQEDLQKIENEMMEYTNGQHIEQFKQPLNDSLFNPTVMYEMED